MMEDTSKQEAPEGEEDAEEGEPEEEHKEERREEPRAQAAPHREGGGWLSKLIWLIILALIAWGGWTAYKRGNADAPETAPAAESAPAAPATTTP